MLGFIANFQLCAFWLRLVAEEQCSPKDSLFVLRLKDEDENTRFLSLIPKSEASLAEGGGEQLKELFVSSECLMNRKLYCPSMVTNRVDNVVVIAL